MFSFIIFYLCGAYLMKRWCLNALWHPGSVIHLARFCFEILVPAFMWMTPITYLNTVHTKYTLLWLQYFPNVNDFFKLVAPSLPHCKKRFEEHSKNFTSLALPPNSPDLNLICGICWTNVSSPRTPHPTTSRTP